MQFYFDKSPTGKNFRGRVRISLPTALARDLDRMGFGDHAYCKHLKLRNYQDLEEMREIVTTGLLWPGEFWRQYRQKWPSWRPRRSIKPSKSSLQLSQVITQILFSYLQRWLTMDLVWPIIIFSTIYNNVIQFISHIIYNTNVNTYLDLAKKIYRTEIVHARISHFIISKQWVPVFTLYGMCCIIIHWIKFVIIRLADNNISMLSAGKSAKKNCQSYIKYCDIVNHRMQEHG